MIKELEGLADEVGDLPETYQHRAVQELLRILGEWEDRQSLPEMSDEEYRELRRERQADVRRRTWGKSWPFGGR